MINVVLNPKTPRVRILGKNGFKLCSSSAQEWWGGTSVQGWAVIERPRMGDGFGWTSIFSSSVQGCTEQIYYEKRKNFSSSAQEWGGTDSCHGKMQYTGQKRKSLRTLGVLGLNSKHTT